MTKPLQRNVLYICLDICNKLCYRHIFICFLRNQKEFWTPFWCLNCLIRQLVNGHNFANTLKKNSKKWTLILNKSVLGVFSQFLICPAGGSRTLIRYDHVTFQKRPRPMSQTRHHQDIFFYSINNLHYKQLLYDICSFATDNFELLGMFFHPPPLFRTDNPDVMSNQIKTQKT